MICGNISNPNPLPFPKAVAEALDYLRYTDLGTMTPGEYELHGRKMLVQIIDMQTAPREQQPVESHRRYLDIQYLCSGDELIGFAPDTGSARVRESKIPGRDIIFYEDAPGEGFIHMVPGTYAMFFPHDLHRPGCVNREICAIRKVVVKVDLNLLTE